MTTKLKMPDYQRYICVCQVCGNDFNSIKPRVQHCRVDTFKYVNKIDVANWVKPSAYNLKKYGRLRDG